MACPLFSLGLKMLTFKVQLCVVCFLSLEKLLYFPDCKMRFLILVEDAVIFTIK